MRAENIVTKGLKWEQEVINLKNSELQAEMLSATYMEDFFSRVDNSGLNPIAFSDYGMILICLFLNDLI